MKKIKMKVFWSKKEKDFVVSFHHKGTGGTFLELLKPKIFERYASHEYYQNDPRFREIKEKERKDPNFLNGVTWRTYEHDILKDLESRGYDPKTFKMEISINPLDLESKFPHVFNSLTDQEKEKLGLKSK